MKGSPKPNPKPDPKAAVKQAVGKGGDKVDGGKDATVEPSDHTRVDFELCLEDFLYSLHQNKIFFTTDCTDGKEGDKKGENDEKKDAEAKDKDGKDEKIIKFE